MSFFIPAAMAQSAGGAAPASATAGAAAQRGGGGAAAWASTAESIDDVRDAPRRGMR